MIVSPDLPCDAGHGLTAGIWEQYLQDSTVRLGLAWPAVGQRLCGDRDYGDLLPFFKEGRMQVYIFFRSFKISCLCLTAPHPSSDPLN